MQVRRSGHPGKRRKSVLISAAITASVVAIVAGGALALSSGGKSIPDLIGQLTSPYLPESVRESETVAEYEISAATYDFEVYGCRIPIYSGEMSCEINGGVPFFTEDEIGNGETWEIYYDTDHLGRATGAYAVISGETMPEGERGELDYNPTGWVQANYDFIDNGGWLYNRCHLIAWSMTGQGSNPCNLITGTRQFNVEGMLPFETEVLSYIYQYNGSCLYRVTPCYQGEELIARGVLMTCLKHRPQDLSVNFMGKQR